MLWETAPHHFFVLTCAIGGAAAFLAGRAAALAWRPMLQSVVYALLLTLAIRFFYYALLGGSFIVPAIASGDPSAIASTLYYTLIDGLVLSAAALLGYRVTRTSQMVTQYPWLYRRTSPLSWAPLDT
ncbi:MAG: DUF6867 family protein [Pseudomonadota bacterium]